MTCFSRLETADDPDRYLVENKRSALNPSAVMALIESAQWVFPILSFFAAGISLRRMNHLLHPLPTSNRLPLFALGSYLVLPSAHWHLS
jgi:hypothetical protein